MGNPRILTARNGGEYLNAPERLTCEDGRIILISKWKPCLDVMDGLTVEIAGRIALLEPEPEHVCSECVFCEQWPNSEGDVFCYFPQMNPLAMEKGKELPASETCEKWRGRERS